MLKASTHNEEIFNVFWGLEGTALIPLVSVNTLALEHEFVLHFDSSAIPKSRKWGFAMPFFVGYAPAEGGLEYLS